MVDDDPNIRHGVFRMLSDSLEWEFQWDEAENGREALEYVLSGPIDIIICDIKMPLIDGIHLLNYVKEISPFTKVIMLSGYDDYSLIRQAMKQGAFDYLLKPLNLASLKNVLDELFEIQSGLSPEEKTINDRNLPELTRDRPYSGQDTENIFFDLPEPGYTSHKELEQYLDKAGAKAALLQTDETMEYLRLFFSHVSPKVISSEQVRWKLSDWVYSLMENNNKFIKPISQDKLTENDLFGHIRNLPTLQQLSDRFLQIMELYLRYLSGSVKSRGDFLVDKALAYLEEHYHENPSLEQVSSSLYISANYFSALFSDKMGVNFRTYLLNRKMEEAKRLLKESDEKIADIAYQLGYEDISHFNRAFRNSVGCSPSHYRRISR